MFACILIRLVASNMFLEYRLWQNHGQVIFDYSLNNRHAFNGYLQDQDNMDCLYSDRGMYFSHHLSHLKSPPNTLKSQQENLYPPYSVLMWINEIEPGRYFFRWSYSILLFVGTVSDKKYFIEYFRTGSGSRSEFQLNDGVYWNFFVVTVLDWDIILYLNNQEIFRISLSFPYFEDSSVLTCGFGCDNPNYPSFKGFLWYAAVLLGENIQDFIFTGTSNNCLSSESCSCSPAFKLDSIIGCITSDTDLTRNSNQQTCKYSKCNGGLLNNCTCESLSCFFDIKTECECFSSLPDVVDTCICPDGESCCNEGCSKCISSDLCTSCNDPNAEVGLKSLCYCKKGFFGKSPLGETDSCSPCSEECSTCTELEVCTECKDSNKILIEGQCKCSKGYFLNSSNLCDSCHPDCLECGNKTSCIECKSKNSEIDEVGCRCKQGFWKKIISKNYECVECLNECESCEKDESCLKCKNNMQLNEQGKCICEIGFYKDNNKCKKCADNCINCNLSISKSDNSECFECMAGFFMNEKKSCTACVENCLTCDGSQTIPQTIKCINCEVGFQLDNSICVCPKGYILRNNHCDQQFFNLISSINSKNEISLNFTKQLNYSLVPDNINFNSSVNILSYKMNNTKNKIFQIKFNFGESIKNKTSLELILEKPIYSSDGSVLDNYDYYFTLFEYDYNSEEVNKMIKYVESASSTSTFIAVSFALFTNPSAGWVLLNTLRIIYFIPLSPYPIPPISVKFCKGLGTFDYSLNILKYFISMNSLSIPFYEARKIGIESSVLWVNIGQVLTIVSCLLLLYPIISLLSKIKFEFLREKITNVKSQYKYNVFIRLWLQSHLFIGVYSLLCFDSNIKILGFESIFTKVISFIFLVLFISSPALIFITLWVDIEKIESNDSEYLAKYGSLFQEFNYDKGLSSIQYYSILGLRSLIFAINQTFGIGDKYAQKTINCFCSLILLLYLLIYRPFKIKLILIENIVTEFIILLVFMLCLGRTLIGLFQNDEYFNLIFISVLMIVLCFQYVVCICLFISKIIELIKKCKKSNFRAEIQGGK